MRVETRRLLVTMTAAALLSATGPMLRTAMAQTASDAAVNKAIADIWWYHGYIDVGGRFFLNNPEKGGIASQGGKSLGKFYEYRDLKPGAIGNFGLSTGTNNGLYQVDIWGKNVGYDDQQYGLDASKAGEQYFNFQWDETPHNYGTGHTIYNGAGSNTLTLPSGLSNQLFTDCGNVRPCADPTAAKQHIEQNLHETDLGIRRDTAAVDWRWTPSSAWDVKANYSNMHRTGTQVDGVVMSWGTSGVRVDAPKPVDDTTQNFGMNGEYQGASPWGQMFTFKLGYNGSIYSDGYNSYTVENPFCPTGAGPNGCSRAGSTSSPLSLVSLWPDNQANGFSATLAADLPAKSRYVGTVSYNMMRQNEDFLPFTITNLGASPNGAPYNSTASLPASSLDGAINTFLSNNVLTTKITPELQSKLSYRYYNFDNNTPEILFPYWIGADNTTPVSTSYAPVQSLSVSYTKQNAGAELNWRPNHQWNLGTAYGFERFSWSREDVEHTNENSGKLYADWTPVVWTTARGSLEFAARRYDTYDYLNRVGLAQWQGTGTSTLASTAYRKFYLDNRDRTKAHFSVAVDLLRNLTITPTFGLQNDDYLLDPTTEVGLEQDHAWNAGSDVNYVLSPETKLLFSYLYERRRQIVTTDHGLGPLDLTSTNYYKADVRDYVNTFIVAVDQVLIPDTLDLRLGYTTSHTKTAQPLFIGTGSAPSDATGGQYPDMKSTFQRAEANLKYTFSDALVRQLGWTGKVVARLGYAWERNSVTNWQLDNIQPYLGGPPYCASGANNDCGYMLWLANDNPNYNVHMVTGSIAFKW